MIRQLIVHNYLCHRRLPLDLDPGVNAFVGTSGHGKSAATIRPLLWLTENEPLGPEFEAVRTWGSDETWVQATLVQPDGNEVTIKHFKRSTDHYYTHSDYDKPFRAFGRKPPEILQQA